MTILTVLHRTTYRYRRSVRFGAHRMMVRPRDSHDLRLLETALVVRPAARVRWIHDVFGNSVAVAEFDDGADELFVESCFRARHYPVAEQAVVLEPYARRFPFAYEEEDCLELGPLRQPHYPDAEGRVAAWAEAFVAARPALDTMALLTEMTGRIREEFAYRRRDEMGTQAPDVTLSLRSGTCRDYALFMMEAVRSLGFAARFVSGYLYDDRLTEAGAERRLSGGGATHAWVQVFLPGGGWVEFDPTNALVGGRNLIRVAVTRDPSQAIPVSGTFTGRRADFIDMTVEVRVTAAAA